MARVRIVTDSTSDLPAKEADRLNITVVPAYVQMGGHSYRDDGSELDRNTFYDQLPTMPYVPTTSVVFPAVTRTTCG